MNLGLPTLVGEGFGMALVIWVTVWGLSLPWRAITRLIGLRADGTEETH
jgi:hypothetical protein